jgi:hypothetical protein
VVLLVINLTDRMIRRCRWWPGDCTTWTPAPWRRCSRSWPRCALTHPAVETHLTRRQSQACSLCWTFNTAELRQPYHAPSPQSLDDHESARLELAPILGDSLLLPWVPASAGDL